MVDRVVDMENPPVEDIDDVLKTVFVNVLEEASDKMEEVGQFVPFTALAIKENMFIETHPGDNVEECFLKARQEVQGARGATAYAFCYDGFLDTDDGEKDIIIAEGGLPGEETGYAFGYFYSINDEGKPEVERSIVYVGVAPNFMENLNVELEMEGSLDPLDNLDEETVAE